MVFLFFLHKYRKRKVFFIGAVGCMLSIYLFSMIVWNIHIEGNYSQTDEVILEFLETKKVYHGMPKAKINCERIAKDIRKQFDDIIWVSVSIQGSRLMIQVKENTDTVPQKVNKEEKVTDLVASENGEVVEIIARSGVPLVSVGDKVKIVIENFHNTSSGFPTVRSLTIFLSPLFLFYFVTIQYLHSYLISFSCVLHWLILYYR